MTWSLIAFALISCAVVAHRLLFGRRRLPPGCREIPGPKGLPWIGRIHDIPGDKPWLKFAEWSDQYGPIYQQTMFGVLHIWVSKERMVQDILAKNGTIASDRTRPAAFPNVPGTKDWKYLPLQGYHDTWRRQRKFAHLMFGEAHEAGYWGYPSLEVPRLLRGLLKRPHDWSPQLDSYIARMLSRCAFATPEHASALCTNAFRLLINISPAGRFSNAIPGVMKIPKSIAWWRVDEDDRQAREEILYDTAQKDVYKQYESGTTPPSFTRTYFENKHKFDFPNDLEAAFNVGMSTMAGIHTTSSPLHTFFLAMTLYPDWLYKLQKQIDAVCGDRHPELKDMPSLPMLRAVIKECIRWRPAVPTGIPHELQADIIYDGYFLPKGCWVHPMEWSLSRDSEVYPDAETFNPGRWLDPKYPTFREPPTQFPTIHGYHQFGFGRRVCQGVNVVETQSFCVMGGVAWAFNIRKRADKSGIEVEVPENDYHPLLITKPNPFQFTLEVRSEEKRRQIDRLYDETMAKDPAPGKEMISRLHTSNQLARGDQG